MFFKFLLIVIFIYLIYRIFFQKYISDRFTSSSSSSDTTSSTKSSKKDSVQKKISMSDVEDADYKEVK
ncbi:MAG: hypothetical protein KAT14_07385 [Candidatus Marinimicrobia bacterium]|nr:hypothetical protein [Candidatus Neomarinimicrobiota bacterium]